MKKQIAQLMHINGGMEDWFGEDGRVSVVGKHPQNYPSVSEHELTYNEALRQFVLMTTGEGWALNSCFKEDWHDFVEKNSDPLEREVKDLRDELLAADEQIKAFADDTPSRIDKKRLKLVVNGLDLAMDEILSGDDLGASLAIEVASELVKISSWKDFKKAYEKAKDLLLEDGDEEDLLNELD